MDPAPASNPAPKKTKKTSGEWAIGPGQESTIIGLGTFGSRKLVRGKSPHVNVGGRFSFAYRLRKGSGSEDSRVVAAVPFQISYYLHPGDNLVQREIAPGKFQEEVQSGKRQIFGFCFSGEDVDITLFSPSKKEFTPAGHFKARFTTQAKFTAIAVEDIDPPHILVTYTWMQELDWGEGDTYKTVDQGFIEISAGNVIRCEGKCGEAIGEILKQAQVVLPKSEAAERKITLHREQSLSSQSRGSGSGSRGNRGGSLSQKASFSSFSSQGSGGLSESPGSPTGQSSPGSPGSPGSGASGERTGGSARGRRGRDTTSRFARDTASRTPEIPQIPRLPTIPDDPVPPSAYILTYRDDEAGSVQEEIAAPMPDEDGQERVKVKFYIGHKTVATSMTIVGIVEALSQYGAPDGQLELLNNELRKMSKEQKMLRKTFQEQKMLRKASEEAKDMAVLDSRALQIEPRALQIADSGFVGDQLSVSSSGEDGVALLVAVNAASLAESNKKILDSVQPGKVCTYLQMHGLIRVVDSAIENDLFSAVIRFMYDKLEDDPNLLMGAFKMSTSPLRPRSFYDVSDIAVKDTTFLKKAMTACGYTFLDLFLKKETMEAMKVANLEQISTVVGDLTYRFYSDGESTHCILLGNTTPTGEFPEAIGNTEAKNLALGKVRVEKIRERSGILGKKTVGYRIDISTVKVEWTFFYNTLGLGTLDSSKGTIDISVS